jgi:hypothetical protein
MFLNFMKEFKNTSPTTITKLIKPQNKSPMSATWNQIKKQPDEWNYDSKS